MRQVDRISPAWVAVCTEKNVQFTASKIVPISFQKMTDRICFQTAVSSSRGVAGLLLVPGVSVYGMHKSEGILRIGPAKIAALEPAQKLY
ncbi:hypothetical protein T11_8147 [Trichinella zimbabwensis]|uniref:Uncharacterized protein n=1 Tax=Trichinella zimbabwensis TaxID=268475 RepID=A0A0V1HZZ5_9BILA|nr:hypothetical protein T11_8147 [Trichinella zimbabwensis]